MFPAPWAEIGPVVRSVALASQKVANTPPVPAAAVRFGSVLAWPFAP